MRRAFVIQLNPQTSQKPCNGRIEHVDTGQSKHFDSVEEAVLFVQRVLSEIEQPDALRSEPNESIKNNEH